MKYTVTYTHHNLNFPAQSSKQRKFCSLYQLLNLSQFPCVCLALSMCVPRTCGCTGLRRRQPHGSRGCQLRLAAMKVIVVHATSSGYKELGDGPDVIAQPGSRPSARASRLKDMVVAWDIVLGRAREVDIDVQLCCTESSGLRLRSRGMGVVHAFTSPDPVTKRASSSSASVAACVSSPLNSSPERRCALAAFSNIFRCALASARRAAVRASMTGASCSGIHNSRS